VAIVDKLNAFFLAHLSKPASDRAVYRAIQSSPTCSIVEIGLGTALRTLRMIGLAQARRGGELVRYTGIDLFEARTAGLPGLSLKDAYRRLRSTGAQVRLIPGTPLEALARKANDLVGTDLLVIASDVDQASLQSAWVFVPRLLHARSRVLVERVDGGAPSFEPLDLGQVQALAAAPLRKAG
jgi:hypothetical protein